MPARRDRLPGAGLRTGQRTERRRRRAGEWVPVGARTAGVDGDQPRPLRSPDRHGAAIDQLPGAPAGHLERGAQPVGPLSLRQPGDVGRDPDAHVALHAEHQRRHDRLHRRSQLRLRLARPVRCAPPAPSVAATNTCGTDPFVRIGYFTSGSGVSASGEVAAAGYGDPIAVVDGWMDEAAGSDGHRKILTDQGTTANTMGYGHATGANCWKTLRRRRLGEPQERDHPQDPHRGGQPRQRSRRHVHLLFDLGRSVAGGAGVDQRRRRRDLHRAVARARHRHAERHLQGDGDAGRRLPQLLHPGARRLGSDRDLPDHRRHHRGGRQQHLQLRLRGDGADGVLCGRRRRGRRHRRDSRHRRLHRRQRPGPAASAEGRAPAARRKGAAPAARPARAAPRLAPAGRRQGPVGRRPAPAGRRPAERPAPARVAAARPPAARPGPGAPRPRTAAAAAATSARPTFPRRPRASCCWRSSFSFAARPSRGACADASDVRRRHALGLPAGPPHGGHLRHHRGGQARLSPQRSGLVEPGAGTARDGAARRRAAADQSRHHRRRRSGVRADPRHLGAARGDRRPLQPALPARDAVAVQRRERQRLGRRARRAHARGGQPRARQPGAFPARLHRLRRAARHLQGLHGDPDPARGRARVRLHRSTIYGARCTGAGWRRCCCRTPATRPASWCRATSSPPGWRWPASSTAPSCSTSSIHTTSGARRPGGCRSRVPPATSRTSTAIR